MIKAENVNYIYQQGMPFERQALYDVNIEIKDGSLVALIGHTGSGKSTLIQHFNALVKPTSGKIIINGIDVTAPKADLRLVRKTVGLVFQYPEHQLFEETVYKDIAFGPKNMGFSDEEIDKRVRESAALVGLKEKHLTRSPLPTVICCVSVLVLGLFIPIVLSKFIIRKIPFLSVLILGKNYKNSTPINASNNLSHNS